MYYVINVFHTSYCLYANTYPKSIPNNINLISIIDKDFRRNVAFI